MKFCSTCGSPDMHHRVPDGDNRHRYVCAGCAMIFYENPKMIVGCVASFEDKVLLCKRAIEPRSGLWTLPAGFMENQETAAQGAAREAYEEAFAKTSMGALYAQFSIAHINQVYLLYLAELTAPDAIAAGEESLEVGLFTESEVPWDTLAFPVMRKTLELFFADRRDGSFRAYSGDIVVNPTDRANPVFNLHVSH